MLMSAVENCSDGENISDGWGCNNATHKKSNHFSPLTQTALFTLFLLFLVTV